MSVDKCSMWPTVFSPVMLLLPFLLEVVNARHWLSELSKNLQCVGSMWPSGLSDEKEMGNIQISLLQPWSLPYLYSSLQNGYHRAHYTLRKRSSQRTPKQNWTEKSTPCTWESEEWIKKPHKTKQNKNTENRGCNKKLGSHTMAAGLGILMNLGNLAHGRKKRKQSHTKSWKSETPAHKSRTETKKNEQFDTRKQGSWN